MEIRYLTASDDRKAISRIYEESWRSAYRGIIPQDYLDAIPEGRWAGSADIPGWHTMVCVENGAFIGTSSFCRSRFDRYPDAGEVISIYLLPEYTGRGYGGELLNAVLGELHRQGFKDVFLWVLEENTRARRFYEKNGFSCTDEYLDARIGGKALREVRYAYRFT
ncbi:MAG: GNAT family N-acetyltransferase [Oscillospiraceae bacterium]|nr:GNAT family N-acetyltransferase [Oscillospiraceae bacterium]